MPSDAPAILYIHGFNSSPQSYKARVLADCLARHGQAGRWRAPALENEPLRAIARLESAIAELGRPLLVGSSLGGYYATYLAERYRLRALLINPAVLPHTRFEGYLGPQTNHHTGERWVLTERHVAEIATLEVAPPSDPERFHVWLQTGDETLDYRDALAFYRGCTLHVEPGGDHSFQGFDRRLPDVLALAGYDPAAWQDAALLDS